MMLQQGHQLLQANAILGHRIHELHKHQDHLLRRKMYQHGQAHSELHPANQPVLGHQIKVLSIIEVPGVTLHQEAQIRTIHLIFKVVKVIQPLLQEVPVHIKVQEDHQVAAVKGVVLIVDHPIADKYEKDYNIYISRINVIIINGSE